RRGHRVVHRAHVDPADALDHAPCLAIQAEGSAPGVIPAILHRPKRTEHNRPDFDRRTDISKDPAHSQLPLSPPLSRARLYGLAWLAAWRTRHHDQAQRGARITANGFGGRWM